MKKTTNFTTANMSELIQNRMKRLAEAYTQHLLDKERGFRFVQLKRGRKILKLL
jgi:hypothetical protein